MLERASWISGGTYEGCPELFRDFHVSRKPVRAILRISALGVYVAYLNGSRVGNFHLAPGWTVYRERLQVQEYDVTRSLCAENRLTVTLGSGWYSGMIARVRAPEDKRPALIAELSLFYADGTEELIVTDSSWLARESRIRYADIYHGETCDACFDGGAGEAVEVRALSKTALIPQQGESVVTMEELLPEHILKTPKGEYVVDFGQEITGFVRLWVKNAHVGTHIRINCAEVLDADGNFYTENYRQAKSEMNYICCGGEECWEPELTFYGFRYIRIEGISPDLVECRAVVLCSDIRRVGWLHSGHGKLNRLFENIVWGQKGNFLDVPTDCPQRDERYGWTGDAQVFINTACWQFDVKRFFTKWLADMMVDQRDGGAVPSQIPDVWQRLGYEYVKSSAAWGDAATVCPWQIWRHYGDLTLLRSHFNMMKKWVGFIGHVTTEPNLWMGYEGKQKHFGDWLGLDAADGSYEGSSDKDLIASAFYYHSAALVVRAGQALGEDVQAYEQLCADIRSAFLSRFATPLTQTECALLLHFGLTDERIAVTEKLVSLIHENGDCLTTGFVGTPYLLFALSENGHTELAYTLLLQEKFPSWLYSVNNGATTIWEHWDGRKPDGSFWSSDMNSFNHYAYGSVASWVYEVAAGITPAKPGFAEVRFEPRPDPRLGHLRAEHETVYGKIVSVWYYEEGRARYEITTPVRASALIDGKEYCLEAGSYLF